SCLTLRSRSAVPRVPRKYFDATTLVAVCDQNFGTSTSFCSKTTSPRSLLMTALRVSHSTWSNGSAPAWLKWRSRVRPSAACLNDKGAENPVCGDGRLLACDTEAVFRSLSSD